MIKLVLQLRQTVTGLFGEDQLSFLTSAGPYRRAKQWTKQTFAKAFKLRLNCGNLAYNYLLEEVFTSLPITLSFTKDWVVWGS